MTTSPTIDLPAGPTRRGFLKGFGAAVGAGSVLPGWLAKAAAAATSPLGPTDGVVVVVMLQGGNDGLNTLVPTAGTPRSLYESLRSTLGVATNLVLPLTADFGLHPKLPKLAARYAAGQVALVQGIGLHAPNLSHFDAQPEVMAGSSTADRTTGWLGRFLDGVPNWDSGVAGLTVATSPRLHLVGTRADVPVLPGAVQLWGTSTVNWDVAAQHGVRALAAAPTGLSAAADRAAQVGLQALDASRLVAPFYPSTPAAVPIVRDLQLAARALNCDVGTRVVGVEMGGWDTHALQDTAHPKLLGQLDDGIEAFWAMLSPALRSRTCMVVMSEFGRRPNVNASKGTDHGTASVAAVIGENVRGGLTGAMPSLTSLDADGNMISTVDFRSLYATVLSRWMGADDHAVLGATYPQLDVFAAGPGAARPT